MTTGPNPFESCSWSSGTTDSSLSWTAVLRPWFGKAEGLPDHPQQLQRDPGLGAQLLKGRAAEPGEPIIGTHIQKREREHSIADSGGQSLQRHAGALQALQPTRPEHVTRRERVFRSRRQDPQLDQPVDVAGVDPSPLGDLLP